MLQKNISYWCSLSNAWSKRLHRRLLLIFLTPNISTGMHQRKMHIVGYRPLKSVCLHMQALISIACHRCVDLTLGAAWAEGVRKSSRSPKGEAYSAYFYSAAFCVCTKRPTVIKMHTQTSTIPPWSTLTLVHDGLYAAATTTKPHQHLLQLANYSPNDMCHPQAHAFVIIGRVWNRHVGHVGRYVSSLPLLTEEDINGHSFVISCYRSCSVDGQSIYL